jgi:hypothetical protein
MHANIILSVVLFLSWFSSSFGVFGQWASANSRTEQVQEQSSRVLMTHFLSFFLCRIKPIIVHGCGSCTRRQTSKTVLTQSNFKAAGSLLFSVHYVVPAELREGTADDDQFPLDGVCLEPKKRSQQESNYHWDARKRRGLGFYDKQDSVLLLRNAHKCVDVIDCRRHTSAWKLAQLFIRKSITSFFS